jgi:hypothetical protein
MGERSFHHARERVLVLVMEEEREGLKGGMVKGDGRGGEWKGEGRLRKGMSMARGGKVRVEDDSDSDSMIRDWMEEERKGILSVKWSAV